MKAKRMIAVFLLLSLLAPPCALPARAAEHESDPSLYLVYPDIQAEQTMLGSEYPLPWGNGCLPATDEGGQLWSSDPLRPEITADGIIYLARNEREGFQLYFTEPEAEDGVPRALTVEVSEFRNAKGETLKTDVFREEYFSPEGLGWNGNDLHIADGLVPYRGEAVSVQPGNNQVFYVEVRSETEQTPGTYYATVTYSDELGVIDEETVAAVVWDFALPQQHYASMSLGLYNAATGYNFTTYFLRQNGVRFDGFTMYPEDKEKANAIVAGWQEYLLDHGISPFEIPQGLIEADEKAAELAMADIRRKNFFVPLLGSYSDGKYYYATVVLLQRYKNLIADNDYLLSKAALYTMDEVDPINDAENITNRLAIANSEWPEIRKLITYNGKGGGTAEEAMAVLKPTENIVCVNTNTMRSNAELSEAYLNVFEPKWRYPAEIVTGGFELWRWPLSTVGPFRRMVFWQQHNNGEDNVLYWNGAYIAGNRDIWGTHTLPGSDWLSTGNGNGLLLYPGLPIGEDPETPIGSLRIKQIAAGIDDADYLYLADEFLPEEERPLWELTSGERVDGPAKARYELGNKLEQVATEHSFGDWHTLVEPDRTHDGMEIRECEHCGTQESRPIDKPKAEISELTVSGGEVSATVFAAEDATAIFASYAEDGRFLGMARREAKAEQTVQLTYTPAPDAQEVKLFLAGANAAPLCASQASAIK